ncbi:Ubiquitin-Conjugating Enzyme E2 U [Manis pentadactyla]|nr:Ubiquitin-Conjugating Enzyme E2 U [Manis pentadactyla]
MLILTGVARLVNILIQVLVDQQTGRPYIDFLDNPEEWNTDYTLSSILLTLQVILSDPVLKNPVNLKAVQMLMEDESMYRLIILKLLHQLLQVKGDSQLLKDTDKFTRSIKAVSFHDYYKTWSGIATSKATEYYRSPCKVI